MPYQLSGRTTDELTDSRLGYEYIHSKCAKLWGLATKHGCSVCWADAVHWAYQHTARVRGEEMLSPDGRPYSLNLDDYAPLCRSHHQRLDIVMTPKIKEMRTDRGRKAGNLLKHRIATDPEYTEKAFIKGQQMGIDLAEKAKNDPALADRLSTTRRANCLVIRMCDECEFSGNPGNMGKHQKQNNHEGWRTPDA